VEHLAEVDAAVVAAHGAAEWARTTQREPEIFTVDAGNYVGLEIDKLERDELERLELERLELEREKPEHDEL
jgi:hypothetical protein